MLSIEEIYQYCNENKRIQNKYHDLPQSQKLEIQNYYLYHSNALQTDCQPLMQKNQNDLIARTQIFPLLPSFISN
ncbi:hypothetical protein pb186bvf_015020 [Paramecium bursaria]